MGVAVPSARRGKPLRDNRQVPRAVVPANLLDVKGHAYLLEAVRLLLNGGIRLRVDLAGDGPLREELARKVEQLGLRETVTFLGLLPHEELLESMRGGGWDMLVLPSIVTDSGEKEGIPVAIVEAMSCRVPVVSTATGAIPELFEGVDDALLVPPKDPAALAWAIERLIKEPGLRERMAESGRRRVVASFSVEQMTAELIKRFEMCGRAGVDDRSGR
jgi:glycosyltransferase involved in cell wall biosynthesis